MNKGFLPETANIDLIYKFLIGYSFIIMTVTAHLIGSIPVGKGVCRQAPVIIRDERYEDEIVVFTTSEGQIQACGFNAKQSDSLVQLWQKDRIDENKDRFSPPFSEIAVSSMGLLAFADEKHLYVLDAHTGTSYGAPIPSGRITSKPVFRKDHFEVIASTGKMINSYSFLNSTSANWSIQATHYAGPLAFTPDGAKLIAAVGNQSFSNGVKIAGYDNNLLRINPNNGEIERTVTVGSRIRALEVSSQGLIYSGAFKSFRIHNSALQTVRVYAAPSPDFKGDVTSLLATQDGVIVGSEGSFSMQGSWGKIQRFQMGWDQKERQIWQPTWETKYSGRQAKLAISQGVLAIGNRDDINFWDMKTGKVDVKRFPVESPISTNQNGVFSWSDGEKVHLWFCSVDASDALNAAITC